MSLTLQEASVGYGNLMYAKVFCQIFDSSIASDPDVRHMFMDLLVLADIDGVVDMTADAIARRTNVPLETTERCLKVLSEPDPKSRSKIEQGRRIMPVDSGRDWGWKIVNYSHYRAIKNEEGRRGYWRDYQRQRRSKTVTLGHSMSRHAEAEAKADTDQVQRDIYHKDSRTALRFLNEASGKSFREVHGNLSVISARLSESGVDLSGVKKMIERQCSMWKGTDMGEYLRPDTLFRPSKFESYYASRNDPLPTAGPKGPIAGAQKPIPSVFNLKTIIEAKEAQAKALKDAHCVEGPLDNQWTDNSKWAQFAALRQEIKALRAQLADLL